MGFLSSLFVALCLQIGQPSLPAALAEQPELLAAWEVVQDPAAERETRLAQADVLLAAVVALPAPEQAPFLLDVLGNGSWPKSLNGAITVLERDWPKFGDRLLEDLVLPMPDRAMRVRGAIRALGLLQSPRPEFIEGLAALLNRESLAGEARTSLTRLTGREFGGANDFDAWWKEAKTQDRATWLESALRETQARELADWRSKLSPPAGAAVPPTVVVAGMQHPRASVRSLAYRALVGLDAGTLAEEQTSALTVALRQAVQKENVAELRVELLPLVPRYLQNGEALTSLLRSLEFGSAKEQLVAATNLQLVRPPRAAWEGLLRGLSRLYPEPTAAPSEASASNRPNLTALDASTQEVRTALWTGLLAVGRNQEVIKLVDTEELKEILGRALVVEEVAVVRDRLFQAVGVYGDASFLPVLQPLVALAAENGGPEVPSRQVPPAERRAALAAMTAVAARGEDPGLLASMLPDLLDDPEVLVRDQAIASVQRLKISSGPILLAGRLSREAETPVLKRLLESLGKTKDAKVLQAVLDFQPPLALRDVYGKTVQVQVGRDFASLELAYQSLGARLDWRSTFALVRKFSHDDLDEAQAEQLDRLYAQAESEHLLEVGVEKEFQGYAEEAVGLLRVLMGREPTDMRWPVYFVELQLMRGAVDEALTVMRTLVPKSGIPEIRRWELGLDTLRFAAAKEELWDSARALLAELDAMGELPEAMMYRAEQVRQMFPPVESTDVEPLNGDQGIVPAPEEGTAEGGLPDSGAEVTEAGKQEDPAADKAPVKEEPAAQQPPVQKGPSTEPPPVQEEPARKDEPVADDPAQDDPQGSEIPASDNPPLEEPAVNDTPAEEPAGSDAPVEDPPAPAGGGF